MCDLSMDTSKIVPVPPVDGNSINELVTSAVGLVERGTSALVDHGPATTVCLVIGGVVVVAIETVCKPMVTRAKKRDKDPIAEGFGALLRAIAKNIERRGETKAEIALRERDQLYAEDDEYERKSSQEAEQRRRLKTVPRTRGEAKRGQPPPTKSAPTDDATVTPIRGCPAPSRRTRNSRRPRRRPDPPHEPGPANETGKQ